MAEYRVNSKQSLVDLSIQLYGSTEYLYKLASENGLQIDSDISPGTVLVYDDSIGDLIVKNNISINSTTIKNPPQEDLQPEGEGIGFWVVGDTFTVT